MNKIDDYGNYQDAQDPEIRRILKNRIKNDANAGGKRKTVEHGDSMIYNFICYFFIVY